MKKESLTTKWFSLHLFFNFMKKESLTTKWFSLHLFFNFMKKESFTKVLSCFTQTYEVAKL